MSHHRHVRRAIPKLNGLDAELGNFILGLEQANGSGYEASRALLQQIDGLPNDTAWVACWCPRCMYTARNGSASGSNTRYSTQDWGRRFLASNGGCAYIDLDHLEVCIPEVLSAWDHVAAWHAMLRLARRAQVQAGARLPAGQSLQVLVNNSDGRGNSYGSHLSFLVARRTWDDLFANRLHYLLFLASYQVSSIVFTGQGKVGSENGAPHCDFALTQRGDFFEMLSAEQTTFRRPIVNSRDESLCGPELSSGRTTVPDLARLHVIFYDATLCHVATLLKVGVMQIVLAMLEADWVRPRLILEEPLRALQAWNHDPTLRARARLLDGESVTAVQLQRRFLKLAKRFAASGGLDGVVPRHAEILALWEDTLERLEARDWAVLARRVDWVLKRAILQAAMQRRPELGWDAPQIKHLDHMYANLDPELGLYWSWESRRQVDRVVDDAAVGRAMHEPPDDTRAWMRTMLLRSLDPDRIDGVDWDRVRVRTGSGGCWNATQTIVLDHPLRFTRARFESGLDDEQGLSALLENAGGLRPHVEGGADHDHTPAPA